MWTVQAQPAVDSRSNAYCIERLQTPAYPKLADAARISGSLTATVKLGPDGSMQDAVLDMGTGSATARRLFPPAVEQALRASAFRKDCSGRSVTLVFIFVLGENPDPNRLQQTVSFGYPNRFWISVPPKIVQP
jgi:outer membrane biosynthesis protein TonB